MVKYIGQANEVIKYITCKHCDAKLEYVPKDIKRKTYRDYSGGNAGEEYIKCPQCDHKVIVNSW